MMTPYKKLQSPPEADTYLKTHISLAVLDAINRQMRNNDAPRQLNEEKLTSPKQLSLGASS